MVLRERRRGRLGLNIMMLESIVKAPLIAITLFSVLEGYWARLVGYFTKAGLYAVLETLGIYMLL